MAPLTDADLRTIRTALMDLRFIQAAAIVASGANEHKPSMDYMRKLHRLTDKIDNLLNQSKDKA